MVPPHIINKNDSNETLKVEETYKFGIGNRKTASICMSVHIKNMIE